MRVGVCESAYGVCAVSCSGSVCAVSYCVSLFVRVYRSICIIWIPKRPQCKCNRQLIPKIKEKVGCNCCLPYSILESLHFFIVCTNPRHLLLRGWEKAACNETVCFVHFDSCLEHFQRPCDLASTLPTCLIAVKNTAISPSLSAKSRHDTYFRTNYPI